MTASMPIAPDGGPRFDPFTVSYAALTEPVSRSEVDQFKRLAPLTFPLPFPSAIAPVLRSLLTVTTLALVGAGAIWACIALIDIGSANGDPNVMRFAMPIMTLIWVAIVCWLAWQIMRAWDFTNRWKKWLRLHNFGLQNGLHFLPKTPRPALSGTVLATNGFVTDRLFTHGARRIDIGNFDRKYTSLASPVRVWGYMAIELERNLPHMVLTSQYNKRRYQGIPVVVEGSQALSLEGDFDKYFTLYAPAKYQRDALYVFSPDLMALMIDEVAAFEVEIIDDWLYFYSPKPFDLTYQPTLSRLMRIAAVVGTKSFRQTDRYHDDRTGAPFAENVVSTPGRRLRTRISLVAVIATVAWVAIMVLRFSNLV